MRMLDLFSGIGGFHKGFEEAGWKFDWVGFSEIDKYASAVYRHRFPDAKEIGDITAIRPERDLPDHIDVLCGGFPCQSFSVAGKRKGWNDTRGTLFFEIERILRHYVKTGKPIDCFVLENVKGLLSHDSGRTFATIHRILTDLDYTVECQLLNTRWVLPQNRERIYIVGHTGKGSGSKIFPIGEADAVYTGQSGKDNGPISNCIDSNYHKGWLDHGQRTMIEQAMLYQVGSVQPTVIITEATKKGYAEAEEGDSINLSVPNSKTRRGRVGKGEAQTLDTGMQQYTVSPSTAIRRLTPKECERLQGFDDDWTSQGLMDDSLVDISDTQRYKQLGNAVSVPIVRMVADRIKGVSNDPSI